jgi:septation ring formation regulator EzrA
MPAEDYSLTPDPDAVRLENELLSLENDFLRGRVRSLEQDLRALRQREREAREALERLRRQGAERPRER